MAKREFKSTRTCRSGTCVQPIVTLTKTQENIGKLNYIVYKLRRNLYNTKQLILIDDFIKSIGG